MSEAAPGWYRMDGDEVMVLRWWDGSSWTRYTSLAPVRMQSAVSEVAAAQPPTGAQDADRRPAHSGETAGGTAIHATFRPPLPASAIRTLVPNSHRPPPAELWLIATAMTIVALLLLWPEVRYGGTALSAMFSGGELGRAIGALVLMVFSLFAALAGAFLALAVGLLRASRVAQMLTAVVSGFVALFALLLSSDTDGAALSGAATAITVLICIGVSAGVLARPTVRAHFAADTRPLGVAAAAAANAYFGWVLIVDGVLMLLAGVVGARFVIIGLLLFGAAAVFIATARPLKAGSRNARAAVLTAYGTLGLALILATAADGSPGAGLIVPLGAMIVATVGLTVPRSSQLHFNDRIESLT